MNKNIVKVTTLNPPNQLSYVAIQAKIVEQYKIIDAYFIALEELGLDIPNEVKTAFNFLKRYAK